MCCGGLWKLFCGRVLEGQRFFLVCCLWFWEVYMPIFSDYLMKLDVQ